MRFNLEEDGFETEIAADGKIALDILLNTENVFDAIVLDVMLPECNGFEVAKTLRENKNYTPILMLTARNQPEDVLQGFEAGADDYLPKPFELSIFLARLKGLLRRANWTKDEAEDQKDTAALLDPIKINHKLIDFANLELIGEKKTLRLTLMEANLLQHLVLNKGKAVSRKEILEKVWGLNEETDTRAIDNFIVRLRRYIEDNPSKPKFLLTVRGIGYKLTDFSSS